MSKKLINVYYYYSNNCDHCNNFKEDWNSLINKCHSEKLPINFYQYEQRETINDPAFKKGYLIDGYPTIILENANKPGNGKEYKGDRQMGAILNKLKIMLGGKNENKKITLFYMNGCYYCDEFLPTWEHLKESHELQKLSVVCEEVERGNLNNVKGIEKYDVSAFPTIYIEVGDQIIQYNGNRSFDDILKKIKEAIKYNNNNNNNFVQNGGGFKTNNNNNADDQYTQRLLYKIKKYQHKLKELHNKNNKNNKNN